MPDDGCVPGKLVVELTAEASELVSPLIPDTLDGGIYTSLGVDVIDVVLVSLPVQAITRLYGQIVPYDVDPDLLSSMIIEDTASKSVPDPGWQWPNAVYGNGIVDAKAAVDRALGGP